MTRIVLDARLADGRHGGIQQVVIGLAGALSQLDDGAERWLFLVDPDHREWLQPHLGGPCRALVARARRAEAPARRLVAAARRRRPGWRPSIPSSDGTVERAGADLVHFTTQRGFRTKVPTVYTPHDLQHRHLPAWFGPQERRFREFTYGFLCRRAALVTAMTRSGAADLATAYSLPPHRLVVVPWGSVLGQYQHLPPIEPALPAAFAFLPAAAWPHKGHRCLFTALAHLAARGRRVDLVCTGAVPGVGLDLVSEAAAAGVADRVHLLGYLPPAALLACYRRARLLVYPSRFEGFGMPVLEAMERGVPVLASDLAVLREVGGSAPLWLPPDDPQAWAAALDRLWDDAVGRGSMAEAGRDRAAGFSWLRAATTFRACYRRLLGCRLTTDDRELLAGAVYS